LFVLTLTSMRRHGAAAAAVLLTLSAAACTSADPARRPAPSISSLSPSHPTTPPRRPGSSADPGESMPGTASSLATFVQAGAAAAKSTYEQGSAERGQPMHPTPGIVEFTTPSGNVSCGIIGSASTASLACEVLQHAYAAAPRPASCRLNWGSGWLSIETHKVVRGLCLGGPPFDPISSVLPYGATLQQGTLTCRSESAFLACADVSTGHGFAVNRTTLKTY
jgi:hypothetical protein